MGAPPTPCEVRAPQRGYRSAHPHRADAARATSLSQHARPLRIIRPLCVVIVRQTIDLDDQLRLVAREIRDVALNRMLAAKLRAKPAPANDLPNRAFSAAHRFAHPARPIAEHSLGQHGD